MKKLIFALILILAVSTMTATGQETFTTNTLRLSPGNKPPAAKIAEIGWLAGHWTGVAMGGFAEEMWSPPKNGAMMGMFRFDLNGKTVFYELITIVEENGSLVLRLKHFHPNLKGWEEKDKTIDFPLVRKSETAMYFEGLTIKREGSDALNIYLVIEKKDGSFYEENFKFQRFHPKGK